MLTSSKVKLCFKIFSIFQSKFWFNFFSLGNVGKNTLAGRFFKFFRFWYFRKGSAYIVLSHYSVSSKYNFSGKKGSCFCLRRYLFVHEKVFSHFGREKTKSCIRKEVYSIVSIANINSQRKHVQFLIRTKFFWTILFYYQFNKLST